MNKKSGILTTVLLFALVILPGLTPIGIIPFGLISLTLIHIPVIVGSVLKSRRTAFMLGLAFALCNTLAAFGSTLAPQSGALAQLLPYSALAVMVIAMVPCIMLPIVTAVVFEKLTEKGGARGDIKKTGTCAGIAALTGTVAYKTLYLVMLGIFFSMFNPGDGFSEMFTSAFWIGTACEIAAAVLITNAVTTTSYRLKKAKEREIPQENTGVEENNEEKSLSDDISSVDEISVAVIPSMDSLLPSLDEVGRRRLERCEKYLDEDNTIMADKAFDAFCKGFSDEETVWGSSVYAIMKFIEMSKYKTASLRLSRFLRSEITPVMVSSEHKQVYLGIMNIIHTSVSNDAQNPVYAARIEPLFVEATDLITAEKLHEAADKFDEYTEKIEAKDRFIRREPVYHPMKDATTSVPVREISEEDMQEGISASDVAVIPTAAGLDLPHEADFTRALYLLGTGADAQEAFEEGVMKVEDLHKRITADLFVILTYFEKNDYTNSMLAIKSCFMHGYDKEIMDGVRPAIFGILTIMHHVLRGNVPENAALADKTIEKLKALYDKGMYILCAQLIDKYFFAAGLAKQN